MGRREGLWIAGGFAAAAVVATAAVRTVARHAVGNPSVPEPAKPVDLQAYLGRWYELARYDQRFERGCEGVTADYRLRPDGRIQVLNRCRKPGGQISEARGIAVVNDASNAKLKVSFFRPFYADYWVLDHADDYSWSIVGEPSGRYLWLLARTANPGDGFIEQLTRRAAGLGYDTTMLIRTKQP